MFKMFIKKMNGMFSSRDLLEINQVTFLFYKLYILTYGVVNKVSVFDKVVKTINKSYVI